MQALNIEIINPEALQLIEGMQRLNLIRIKPDNEPRSKINSYLKKMRKQSVSAPGLEEISQIVKDVRKERYAKK